MITSNAYKLCFNNDHKINMLTINEIFITKKKLIKYKKKKIEHCKNSSPKST